MEFAKSPRSTLGIEWELQLIDTDSNDLRQSADAVMDRVEALGIDTSMVHREMLLNTVELVSRPHKRVADACADLEAGLEIVRSVVEPMRITLGSAGSHPFANPAYQRVTDSARYAELVKRTQYWGRQMLLFGTHIHIGIESRDKVLPILNALLTRFAQLQAVTAASPFWSGQLTGYADNRAMVFQQLPTAGTPHQFDTWDQLQEYAEGMLKTGVIEEFDEIRWDIRPSPKFGTLEIRVCDAATNIAEVGMVAALCQCWVEYFSRELDAGRELPTIPPWFVSENKWRAARYGMDAILILDREGNEEHVEVTLRRCLEFLLPIAQDLGCVDELMVLERVLELGAPYQRFLKAGKGKEKEREAIVDFMIAEMIARQPLDPTAIDDVGIAVTGKAVGDSRPENEA
ncbi:MAG: glutamate--cysteine ligase [Actinomycetaceae bacterium]|nr:glutamate--cysteine ligase [Actinomycetaceae bacterium]